jgi:Tfp pilus assembly protein PilF
MSRFGIGGHYLGGKEQFLQGRKGNMDRAIRELESVVREDPTYKDSLTLLGRAYYRKGRFEDAKQVLTRALAVNKEDAIAWVALALTQLRLGEDQKGLETFKGAITLLSKVSVAGYRGYPDWDSNHHVRSSIRRTVFLAKKGLDEKKKLIRTVETLLVRIDDEENFQRIDTARSERNKSDF